MSWFAYKNVNKSGKIRYTCTTEHYFIKPKDSQYYNSICEKRFYIPIAETIINEPLPHCKKCGEQLKNNPAKYTALKLKQRQS